MPSLDITFECFDCGRRAARRFEDVADPEALLNDLRMSVLFCDRCNTDYADRHVSPRISWGRDGDPLDDGSRRDQTGRELPSPAPRGERISDLPRRTD